MRRRQIDNVDTVSDEEVIMEKPRGSDPPGGSGLIENIGKPCLYTQAGSPRSLWPAGAGEIYIFFGKKYPIWEYKNNLWTWNLVVVDNDYLLNICFLMLILNIFFAIFQKTLLFGMLGSKLQNNKKKQEIFFRFKNQDRYQDIKLFCRTYHFMILSLTVLLYCVQFH